MKVKINSSLISKNANQIIKYLKNEFSFFTENSSFNYFSSILVNDINIFFNDHGVAYSIFGVSPMIKWVDGVVSVPSYKLGSLVMLNEFTAGVSYRVNFSNEYWPVIFDKENGWIEIKKNCKYFDSVKIFDGVIIGVAEGEIVGLWLHPIIT